MIFTFIHNHVFDFENENKSGQGGREELKEEKMQKSQEMEKHYKTFSPILVY